MAVRTIFKDHVPEKSTWQYCGTFKDEAGVVIPGSSLASLKLSLYDKISGTAINSVTQVNILNTGRGTVDENGRLTVKLLPLDNPITVSTRHEEAHIMLLEWTWGSLPYASSHEVEFTVSNRTKVT